MNFRDYLEQNLESLSEEFPDLTQEELIKKAERRFSKLREQISEPMKRIRINKYIREEITQVLRENPGMKNVEAYKLVASKWRSNDF